MWVSLVETTYRLSVPVLQAKLFWKLPFGSLKLYVGCQTYYKVHYNTTNRILVKICQPSNRSVASIHAHKHVCAANIWKIFFFYFPKNIFYHFIGMTDKCFALFWCFCVSISYIFLL